jgi:hypothetical protein
MVPFESPSFQKVGFNCPHCNAFSNQRWAAVFHNAGRGITQTNDFVCICDRCSKHSYWVDQAMVYPLAYNAPLPNADLPPDIAKDFNEARTILVLSPKGAAALLRLCIQKLCVVLGESGKNINDDIKELVKKGLPGKVQQALDIVRVVGNSAVHPGQIDFDDDPEIASQLFELVNLISEIMISQPKHVAQLYQTVVPQSQRDAIVKRDTT